MSKVLDVTNVPWAPVPNRVVVNTERPDFTVTASHVIVLCKNSVLLTHVVSRGWDIPGGHVEGVENPVAAALREVQEETGIVLESVTHLGQIQLSITGDRPASYAYPYPHAAQQVFFARLEEQTSVSDALELECDEAKWLEVQEASELCKNRLWLPLLQVAVMQ